MRVGRISYSTGDGDIRVLLLEMGERDLVKKLAEAAKELGAREFAAAVGLAGLNRKAEMELRRIGEVWAGLINVATDGSGTKEVQKHLWAAIRAAKTHSLIYREAKEKLGRRGAKIAAWTASDPLTSIIAGIVASLCISEPADSKPADGVAVVLADDSSLARNKDFHRRLHTALMGTLKPLDLGVRWVRTMRLANTPGAPATVVRGDVGTISRKDKASLIVSTAYDMGDMGRDKRASIRWVKLDGERLARVLQKGLRKMAKVMTVKTAERRELPVASAWIKLVRSGTWRFIKTVGEYGAPLTPVTAVNYLSKIVKDEHWERLKYFDHDAAYRVARKAIKLCKEGKPVREAVKEAAEEEFGEDKVRERRGSGTLSDVPVNAGLGKLLREAVQWTSYFPWKDKWWHESSPKAVVQPFKRKLEQVEQITRILRRAVDILERALGRYEEGDPKLGAVDSDLVEAAELLMVAARFAHEHEDTDPKEIAKELAKEVVKAMSWDEREAKEKAELIEEVLEEHAKEGTKELTKVLQWDSEAQRRVEREGDMGWTMAAKRALERLMEKAKEKSQEIERYAVEKFRSERGALEVYRDWPMLVPTPGPPPG